MVCIYAREIHRNVGEKLRKFKVGYTAGAFDLFHIGHLNILRNAKQHVDRLIVGVSVDNLIQEYKKRPPVIPFEERIEIVRSIKFTDEAVPQSDIDKVVAWKSLNFDVLFVGDDWKGNTRWVNYEKQLGLVGVPILYLPYTSVTSSSTLRNALSKLSDD
jgi:glycerol-3-phosphate cytidylyltransferase